MAKKVNQEVSIYSEMDIYSTFSDLIEQRLMTPTYLSTLTMLLILPAKLIVEKDRPLANDEQGVFSEKSWYKRSATAKMYGTSWFETNYEEMAQNYLFSSLSVNGLETLEAKQKNSDLNQLYEIFFCSNGQDAMDFYTVCARIKAQPNKNHIFWNYPEVGSSLGTARSANDLFKAGYQQAKRLIDQDISAQDITLYGISLGGGVAVHVARQLHEEGHLVNLEIDRSFARISSVISANLKRNMLNQGNSSVESSYAPLITSMIVFSISGVALGSAFAGFIASIGLVIASTIASIAYLVSFCIQIIGALLQETLAIIGEVLAIPLGFFSKSINNPIKTLFDNIKYYLNYLFNATIFLINETISMTASFIDNTINFIGSIIGGGIALGGLVIGSLAGLCFGMLLSIQLLWTNKPLALPMTPAFSMLLHSLCCELDCVNEIYRLLSADNKSTSNLNIQPKIRVINTTDDEVVEVAASLNLGLGFKPGRKPSNDENRPFKEKITSFWYRGGGHCKTLKGLINPQENDMDSDFDPNTSFIPKKLGNAGF